MSSKRTSPQDRPGFATRRKAQIVVAVTKITFKKFVFETAQFFSTHLYIHMRAGESEHAGSLQRGSRLEQ